MIFRRFIFIWIVLFSLCQLNFSVAGNYQMYRKKKYSTASEIKKFTQETENEIPNSKRKYKSKGLQIIAPVIPDHTYNQFVYASIFSYPQLVNSISTFFFYEANGKRGPPALSV